MDLEIPSETTTDFLIRVGLYISAIFQLTCILAIILMPDKHSENYQNSNGDLSDHESWEAPPCVPQRNFQHRSRKQDKKKRR